MYRRWILLAICILLPTVGQANFCLWLVKFAAHTLHRTSGPQPSEKINLLDGRTLEFKKFLGEGRSGRIQRIGRHGDYPFLCIVKYARNPKAQARIEREYEAYRKLLEINAGRGPRFVVPILEVPLTRGGRRVIIKPELHGTPLEKYIAMSIELDPPQKKSLRDLRAWAVQVADAGLLDGRRLDLNPGNLVWIDDANDLQALGMEIDRPTFVLYEIDRAGFFDTAIYKWLFFWHLLR